MQVGGRSMAVLAGGAIYWGRCVGQRVREAQRAFIAQHMQGASQHLWCPNCQRASAPDGSADTALPHCWPAGTDRVAQQPGGWADAKRQVLAVAATACPGCPARLPPPLYNLQLRTLSAHRTKRRFCSPATARAAQPATRPRTAESELSTPWNHPAQQAPAQQHGIPHPPTHLACTWPAPPSTRSSARSTRRTKSCARSTACWTRWYTCATSASAGCSRRCRCAGGCDFFGRPGLCPRGGAGWSQSRGAPRGRRDRANLLPGPALGGPALPRCCAEAAQPGAGLRPQCRRWRFTWAQRACPPPLQLLETEEGPGSESDSGNTSGGQLLGDELCG
jgi:hypothetical protein